MWRCKHKRICVFNTIDVYNERNVTPWSVYVCEKSRFKSSRIGVNFFQFLLTVFCPTYCQTYFILIFWFSTAVVYIILVFGAKLCRPRPWHRELRVVVVFCIRLHIYRLRRTDLACTGTRRCSARSLIKTKLHSANQWKDSACPRGFIRGGAALRSRFEKKPINYRLVPDVVIPST